MEPNNNNQTVIREQKGSGGWLWWLLGILVLLGILWFVFGTDITDPTDPTDPDRTPSSSVEYGEDIEYDQNGLPVLGPLAPISSVEIVSNSGFPVGKSLLVRGELANGCSYLNEPQQTLIGNTFYVNLTTRTEGEVCTEALVPYERNISLDVLGLPAGNYLVDVNGQSYSFNIEQNNALDFESGSDK